MKRPSHQRPSPTRPRPPAIQVQVVEAGEFPDPDGYALRLADCILRLEGYDVASQPTPPLSESA